MLIQAARHSGVSAYVGDGAQRWPAVHRDDAARLFRLALEEAAPGSVLHAVGDEADPMRAIADVIGRRLDLPVESAPAENFGMLGVIFGVDQPSSSAHTRAALGWEPAHPGLLDDQPRPEPIPAADAVRGLLRRIRPQLEELGDWATVSELPTNAMGKVIRCQPSGFGYRIAVEFEQMPLAA